MNGTAWLGVNDDTEAGGYQAPAFKPSGVTRLSIWQDKACVLRGRVFFFFFFFKHYQTAGSVKGPRRPAVIPYRGTLREKGLGK